MAIQQQPEMLNESIVSHSNKSLPDQAGGDLADGKAQQIFPAGAKISALARSKSKLLLD